MPQAIALSKVPHPDLVRSCEVGDVSLFDNLFTIHPPAQLCVDCLDKRGMAPLHIAAGFGHAKIIDGLLAHGAKATLLTSHGISALHCAATSCKSGAALSRLLELDLPIDHQDEEHGLSPLMMAAHRGHAACVSILLRAGANHTLALPDGTIPPSWARKDARWLAAHNGHAKVEEVFAELVGGSSPAPPSLSEDLARRWSALGLDRVDGLLASALLVGCAALALAALLWAGHARSRRPREQTPAGWSKRDGPGLWPSRLGAVMRRLTGYAPWRSSDPQTSGGRRRARRRTSTRFTTQLFVETTTTRPAGSSDGSHGLLAECVICMDGLQTHALVPCGHQCICDACSESLTSELAPTCPACRAPVEQAIRVFKLD
jgi:hypothetical protein